MMFSILGSIFMTGFLFANEGWEPKMQSLIELRREIETLASEVELDKANSSRELDLLRMQKNELQSQIQKERLKSQVLGARLNEQSEFLKGSLKLSVNEKNNRTQFLKLLSQVEMGIQSGVPYKISERIQPLKEIREGVESQQSMAYALQKFWMIMEKETKLLFDHRKESVNVSSSDKPDYLEVVRLGLREIYFIDPTSAQVGRLVNTNGTVGREVFSREEEKQAITRMAKKINESKGHGYFELPIKTEVF